MLRVLVPDLLCDLAYALFRLLDGFNVGWLDSFEQFDGVLLVVVNLLGLLLAENGVVKVEGVIPNRRVELLMSLGPLRHLHNASQLSSSQERLPVQNKGGE